MSDEPLNLTFEYDAPPIERLLKPGATRVWVVVGSAEVGAKVQVAESMAITDDDGNGFIDVGEFQESTVVDTPPEVTS